jgi:uncharacterized protein (DUF736 family)
MNHECPAIGCTRKLPRHLLMCAPHWRLVPRGLQAEVYAAWANYDEDMETYLAVRQRAVDAVNAKLTPKAQSGMIETLWGPVAGPE